MEAGLGVSEPSLHGTVIVEVTPEVTTTMVVIGVDVCEVPFVGSEKTLPEILLPEDRLLIEEEHGVLVLAEEKVLTEFEVEPLLDNVEADDVLVDVVEEDEVVVAMVVDDVLDSNEEDEDRELVSGVQLAMGNDCTKTPDCVPLFVTSISVHASLSIICID